MSDEYYEQDIASLKKLVKTLMEAKELENSVKLELFFNLALTPYYSPDGDLSVNAGHIIYRFSDFIPEETRKCIEVYPSERGSIIRENSCWDSLEDWRKEWSSHLSIPDFIKKIAATI